MLLRNRNMLKQEAQRLYVQEFMTIEEIALKLKVSVRTINYWKKDKDWNEKKKDFLKTKQVSELGTYYFAKRMLYKLEEDMAKGRKVSSKRLYSFTRILDSIRDGNIL